MPPVQVFQSMPDGVALPSGLVVPRRALEEHKSARRRERLEKAASRREMQETQALARREDTEATLYDQRARVAAKRRRTQLFSPYSIHDVFLGVDKPGFSYGFLRTCAERSVDIAALLCVIETEFCEMLQLAPYGVPEAKGWSVEHKDWRKSGFHMSKEQQERAEKIAEELLDPHPTEPGFMGFLVKLLREMLVVDRVAVELVPSELVRRAPRVGKNRIAGFCLTDGASIRTVPEAAQKYVEAEMPGQISALTQAEMIDAYAKTALSSWKIDLTNKSYIQFVDGVPFAAFGDDEMIVFMTSPRADMGTWGHGQSRVEKAIFAILAQLQNWGLQINSMSESLPEKLLAIAGVSDPDMLQEVEDQIADLATGVRKRNRVPVIELEEQGSIQAIDLRNSIEDLGVPERENRLRALLCAFLDEHPSRINAATIPNGQTLLQESDPTAEIDMHSAGGKWRLIQVAAVMTKLVQKYDPDYVFRWHGVKELYETQDKGGQDFAINAMKNYASVNQVRERYHMPKYDKKHFMALGHDEELAVQLATLADVPTELQQHAVTLMISDAQHRHEVEQQEQEMQQQAMNGGATAGQPGQDLGGPPEQGVDDQGTGDPDLDALVQRAMNDGGDSKAANGNGKDKAAPGKDAAKDKLEKAWGNVIYLQA